MEDKELEYMDWMSLTCAEKIRLIQDGIKKWKNKEQPYAELMTKYSLAASVMDDFYNSKVPFEFRKTPPYEAQKDVWDIINVWEI